MIKVIRFLGDDDGGDDGRGGTGWTALELPDLPPPRFRRVAIARVAAAGPGDVVVDEEVRRGAVPAGRFMMMSVARRHPSLSRREFAERWRAEAGTLGGEAIPDDVRGLAYVQDHPVGDDPPFDAINEVWFDDLEGLRRRAEWFAARPVPADLFSPEDGFSLYLQTNTFSGD